MGKDTKGLTWDQFIEIVTANYPKATPEKILNHVKQTYGGRVLKSSWKYEACWLFFHQAKEDQGKRNSNGKLITKYETCFKVAGSEGFKTWWPRFNSRKYESITNASHATNLQMLVNKNKNLLKSLAANKGYYGFFGLGPGPTMGTGLGHTRKLLWKKK
jgi:hypothetical protein